MSEIIATALRTARQNILLAYIYWHFVEMPEKLLKVWFNLVFLAFHRFFVITHLKTFFNSYRRYHFSGDNRKVELADMIFEWFGALVMNIFSRLVGILFRLILISCGLFMAVLMFILGGIVFMGWFILPVLALIMIKKGITFLI